MSLTFFVVVVVRSACKFSLFHGQFSELFSKLCGLSQARSMPYTLKSLSKSPADNFALLVEVVYH